MRLLAGLEFNLPLSNPVLIFSLVLFIILFAPLLLNKFKIPHIIGLIIAGVLIGPYGFNLLLRDSSIVLFGTVGLLYIMFLAGLEIDMAEFKKNTFKSIVFGLLTFSIPMGLGYLAGYYLLGFGMLTSVLLASMFASHTLLAYPIASRYGVIHNRSVTLTVGGTIITDTLALLVLAVIVAMTKGEMNDRFWKELGISMAIFAIIVFLIFPFIIRWFFKKFDDNISQYIFVLAIVFLGAFLAQMAGMEAIIGAFMSGLTLNRFIPKTSPLMNRIDFVGNAFFIPFFLIGVGMLVDVRVLFMGVGALKVAVVMIGVAILAKWLAAWFTQNIFRMSVDERRMIFGLSSAQAAATLAAVMVGYNIIIGETATGEPLRLLNEEVLNGTILMILVTCTISSFATEKASRNLALPQEESVDKTEKAIDRILISVAYPETVTDLVDLALNMKPTKSKSPLYALHVVDEEDSSEKAYEEGKKMMDKALRQAAGADEVMVPINRFDANISNGIIYTIKEHNITDIIIGLHHKAYTDENEFLGPVVERVLKRTYESIYVYKNMQPLNTLKRLVVVVPPRAEFEPGFSFWFDRLHSLAQKASLSLKFYGERHSIGKLQLLNRQKRRQISAQFEEFSNWEDFLIFTKEIKQDDLFVIVSSRKGYVSYLPLIDRLPYFLTRYFFENSLLIIYPMQLEQGFNMENILQFDKSLMEPLPERLNLVKKAGRMLKKIFGK
jgi:Kef-type K+ transport system membrane component KefB